MIFLKINLPNFVQFKQYQSINWDYALGLAYFVQRKIFQFSLLNINSLNTDSLRMVAQGALNALPKQKRHYEIETTNSETETAFW